MASALGSAYASYSATRSYHPANRARLGLVYGVELRAARRDILLEKPVRGDHFMITSTYISRFLVLLQACLVVVFLYEDAATRSKRRFVVGSLCPSGRLRAQLEARVKSDDPFV
jgi:hypothetical protein